MSARFVDYWESYGIPHDDRSKDYLEPEDLIVKAKYAMFGKALKFSGKTKFGGEDDLSAVNDYSLTGTISPWSSYIFTHKTNNIMLDGNFKLYAKDQTYVSLYTNTKLEQNEKKRALPSKLHVRVHHQDNKIFSVGVENLDIFKSTRPDVFSAYGLIGTEVQNGVKVYGGVYSGFQASSKAFLFHKFLAAYKHKDLTSYLEVGVNRKVEKSTNEETKEVTEKISYTKSATLRFDANIQKGVTVGGDVAYNFDNAKVDTKVFGSVDLGDSTTFRWKVASDNSLHVGLLRNYRGLINFGFCSRFNLVHPVKTTLKEGEVAPKSHFKTRFGIIAEINETLI